MVIVRCIVGVYSKKTLVQKASRNGRRVKVWNKTVTDWNMTVKFTQTHQLGHFHRSVPQRPSVSAFSNPLSYPCTG